MDFLCYKHTFASLIIFVLFISSISTVAMSTRSEYGEYCNATLKCNRSAWLNCQDGLCACAKKEEMQFDPNKKKCVSRAGERCKFEISDNIFERSDCVANASCDFVGICMCHPLFFEIENGTCLAQRGSGEACTADRACRTDGSMKCIDGACACEPGMSEVSVNNNDCIGLAGRPCLKNVCTPNSTCGSDENCTCSSGYFQNSARRCEVKREYMEPCSNTNECKTDNTFLSCGNGTCNCQPNHSKWSKVTLSSPPIPLIVKSGTCIDKPTEWDGGIHSPNFPASYDHSEVCHWQITAKPNQIIRFTILSRTLECNPDDVFVHDGDSTSGSILLSACSSNPYSTVLSTGNQLHVYFRTDGSVQDSGWKAKIELIAVFRDERFECVGLANSQCSKNGRCVKHAECSPERKCICMGNYAPTSTGDCGLSHGETCNSNEDACSDSFVCSDGKCSCKHPFHQIYNDGDSKCISLVSGPCSGNASCVIGAYCNLDAETGLGFCECGHGRVENKAGTCDLANGSNCKYISTDECDSIAGLSCRNGACSCPDESMLFSVEDRKCKGLVHFRCSKAFGCVENAECITEYEGLPGKCKCRDGFKESRDRLCIPS